MAKHNPSPAPAPVPELKKVKMLSMRIGDIVIALNGESFVLKYKGVVELEIEQAEKLISMHEPGELQIL